MTYQQFVEQNRNNVETGVAKLRIEKIFNNGKTCMLRHITDKHKNPMLVDIVHVVAEVKVGNIALTNPSIIKNWKYFNK